MITFSLHIDSDFFKSHISKMLKRMKKRGISRKSKTRKGARSKTKSKTKKSSTKKKKSKTKKISRKSTKKKFDGGSREEGIEEDVDDLEIDVELIDAYRKLIEVIQHDGGIELIELMKKHVTSVPELIFPQFAEFSKFGGLGAYFNFYLPEKTEDNDYTGYMINDFHISFHYGNTFSKSINVTKNDSKKIGLCHMTHQDGTFRKKEKTLPFYIKRITKDNHLYISRVIPLTDGAKDDVFFNQEYHNIYVKLAEEIREALNEFMKRHPYINVKHMVDIPKITQQIPTSTLSLNAKTFVPKSFTSSSSLKVDAKEFVPSESEKQSNPKKLNRKAKEFVPSSK